MRQRKRKYEFVSEFYELFENRSDLNGLIKSLNLMIKAKN